MVVTKHKAKSWSQTVSLGVVAHAQSTITHPYKKFVTVIKNASNTKVNCVKSQHLSNSFLIYGVMKWEVCRMHFCCKPK
jgi:hypothetical protein